MRELFTHVQVRRAKKRDNEEIMDRNVMTCEKAIESGKREHLPKILQTKLDKEKCEMHDNTGAKANSPPKPAETAVPIPPVTTTCAAPSTMGMASTKVKEGEATRKLKNYTRKKWAK